MSVNTFGVAVDDVRADHFPNWTPFSTSSNPTLARVTAWLSEEASDLAGKLRLKSIDPTTITDATTEAYLWCAKTLKLMVAVRVYPSVTAGNPDGLKVLQAQLDTRLKWLEEHGLELDGAGTLLTNAHEGPTSHISEYSLTTADPDYMSTTESPFHKDDPL